jgi:hypothetical protein
LLIAQFQTGSSHWSMPQNGPLLTPRLFDVQRGQLGAVLHHWYLRIQPTCHKPIASFKRSVCAEYFSPSEVHLSHLQDQRSNQEPNPTQDRPITQYH